MEFLVAAQCPGTGDEKTFIYDNVNSSLRDGVTGERVAVPDKLLSMLSGASIGTSFPELHFGPDRPLVKDASRFRKISIVLGFACNFECAYCSVRLSANHASGGVEKAREFLETLPKWFKGGEDGLGKGVWFEFWGGEPFVYWKMLKPLAEGVRESYPNAKLFLVTNGSLLNPGNVSWLDELGFYVTISHDGPGQSVRGKDPLHDPIARAAILELYQRLKPQQRIAFNAVLHPGNPSRKAIHDFLADFTGDPDVSCGIGRLADPEAASGCGYFHGTEDVYEFRRNAFEEVRAGVFHNFKGISTKISGFLRSIARSAPAQSIGTRCMWHDSANIAVDMNGNVTTCPHASFDSPFLNGRTHKVGDIRKIEDVRVDTLIQWRDRPACGSCPMLHICRGACAIKTGEDWAGMCEISYTDSVPVFASTFEWLTGYIPVRIDGGDLAPSRRDLFGLSIGNAPGAMTDDHVGGGMSNRKSRVVVKIADMRVTDSTQVVESKREIGLDVGVRAPELRRGLGETQFNNSN